LKGARRVREAVRGNEPVARTAPRPGPTSPTAHSGSREFIDAHGGRFGVAPICRVLSEHGCKIAPSTYYDAKDRPPSKRALRDAELKVEIARVHATNYGVYGPRKVWLQLNREGIEVARCTVERLMSVLGLQGIRRGKKWKTTTADPAAARTG
jgi:putative transposase